MLGLHPRDIGAWIIAETSSGLKVCYQIVALGQPDIVYAVPIMKAIRGADTAFVITLPVRTSLLRARVLTGWLTWVSC